MSLETLHFYVLKIRKLISPVSITFFKHQCYRGFGNMWRPLLHCSFALCFLTDTIPVLPSTFLCGLLVSPAHWDACTYKSTVFYGIQLKKFSSRDMHSECARHCEDTEWHWELAIHRAGPERGEPAISKKVPPGSGTKQASLGNLWNWGFGRWIGSRRHWLIIQKPQQAEERQQEPNGCTVSLLPTNKFWLDPHL